MFLAQVANVIAGLRGLFLCSDTSSSNVAGGFNGYFARCVAAHEDVDYIGATHGSSNTAELSGLTWAVLFAMQFPCIPVTL